MSIEILVKVSFEDQRGEAQRKHNAPHAATIPAVQSLDTVAHVIAVGTVLAAPAVTAEVNKNIELVANAAESAIPALVTRITVAEDFLAKGVHQNVPVVAALAGTMILALEVFVVAQLGGFLL